MARRNANDGAIDPALSQKKRARRRLIGAAAVALAVAIVLPLVLDSEPRQHYPDVEVDIPSRDIALRVPVAPPDSTSEVTADGAARPDSGVAGQPSPRSPVAPVPADPVAPAPDTAPAAGAGSSSASPPSSGTSPGASPAKPLQSPAKSRVTADPSSATPPAKEAPASQPGKPAPSAQAAKPAPAPAASSEAGPAQQQASVAERSRDAQAGRYVLQIGAYANAGSAKTMSERARKVGVRSYTESVKTADGARTRVRVGPFTDRDSAERARGKLALVGIDSSIVALSQ